VEAANYLSPAFSFKPLIATGYRKREDFVFVLLHNSLPVLGSSGNYVSEILYTKAGFLHLAERDMSTDTNITATSASSRRHGNPCGIEQ
jgi:hypothetical protein